MTDNRAYRNLPYRITDGGIVPVLILSLAFKKVKSQWLMQVTVQVAYPFGHTKNTYNASGSAVLPSIQTHLPGHSTAAGNLY